MTNVRSTLARGQELGHILCEERCGRSARCKRGLTAGGETPMAAKEGYCVKCKAKREIKDAKEITMKNGRPATQGLCPTCGTKMFKIGK